MTGKYTAQSLPVLESVMMAAIPGETKYYRAQFLPVLEYIYYAVQVEPEG